MASFNPFPGNRTIAHVALIVRDYDEAIDFYTNKMGFTVVEDTSLGNGKRWVLVSPSPTPAPSACGFLLAKSNGSPQQDSAVGNQCGGRVGFFLQTDDFYRDYERMKGAGVIFHEEPREEVYATVAVCEDLYGNKFDLLQKK
eukprot:Nk52_evm8s227 gene=Nk52_evmTU8s227